MESGAKLPERPQKSIKRASHLLGAALALLWFAYLALVAAHQLPEIPLPGINIAQYGMRH
jgi:hypothetical protein